MCKVLIIPAIKKHRMKETILFIRAMGSAMSKSNNDGLGYAAINANGDLFGERWFVNAEAFKPPAQFKAVDYTDKKEIAEKNLAQFGKALKYHKTGGWTKETDVPRYNRYGNDILDNAVAITLHTRAATCDKNLMNVHPFVDPEMDTSVIHNGVISNVKDFDLKLSTCDSESILISYLKNGVNKDIGAVQGMVDQLRGYYACGVFSRDADGNRILDVFKYSNNWLSIAYIYELETYVMASSDNDIKEICRALGFHHDGTQDIHDDFITRINPFTGDVIAQASYTKPSYTPAFPNYHGSSTYDPDKKKATTSTSNTSTGHSTATGAANKVDKSKVRKIIDKHMALMMAEKSELREFGPREVEEYEKVVGWDS